MEFSVAQNGASCHIRLGPLSFPLDLAPLPDVAMELAQAAKIISITFKNVDGGKQGEKSGFIVASFASVETANRCFKIIEAMIASSDREWKLEQIPVNDTLDVTPSQHVVGEPLSEDVVCNGELQPADGCVLVGGLLPSVDEQTLADIFGASDVVSVKFSHEPGQLFKSAVVQFKTKHSAEAAINSYEGYELDDGATKTRISMQLFQGDVLGESVNPPLLESNADREDQTERPSNGHVEPRCENLEPTPEQICASIRELMIAERTNWAELAGVEDLWLILDKVVQTIGWQPEETLKEAMMTTLQTALAECEYDWLTEHLKMLLRRWAKEADNPDKSKIRRRLLLVSAEGRSIPGHDHVPPLAKKSRKRNNKQSIALMGIGGVLSNMKSESEQPTNSKSNLPVEKAKKKTTSEQRSSAKRRKRKQSSSESGEASSTSSASSSADEDEEREEGEYRKSKTRRHRASSVGSKSKNTTSNRRSKQIDPEWTQSILEQVIPHMFRMMPKLIEWMNINNSSSLDPQFRQETVNMTPNFSNPGMMPLPMNNYAYRGAPSVPVGPPYAPPMVANLNVPPPINVSQPLYGVNSSAYSYSGATIRMPFPSAPPPPPNRQY
ncbi:Spliced leader 175 kDa protein [Trichuris trichiura]|uniref:Spliced leader 175 kDa protein n=1 Tax=Trichuris trichiura TaxID=36087 RepID=A0A077Z6B6_TRITR|nr:Spliced leader 175 kDa protein [Trichuris trichiura]